jgi:hypothetical protein
MVDQEKKSTGLRFKDSRTLNIDVKFCDGSINNVSVFHGELLVHGGSALINIKVVCPYLIPINRCRSEIWQSDKTMKNGRS